LLLLFDSHQQSHLEEKMGLQFFCFYIWKLFNYFFKSIHNKEAQMSTSEMKLHSLSEMKDKYLGKLGSEERDHYEYELRMEVLGKMIKSTRQERKLTQEELGQLVGVQKAQISKLESSANSATVDTLLKIFIALKAEINFSVKLDDRFVKLP
jgi:DNA-binding XRE family transcriptional regulator